MRRLVLMVAVAASVATSQEPSPAITPDEASPKPAVSPEAQPAPAVDTACEPVYFACQTENGKPLEVCGDPVQYRFGANDEGPPDLELSGVFTVEERTFIRSMGNVVRFENEGYAYEVTEMMGSGGGTPEEAAANNFTGVMVFKGDELVSTIDCAEQPQTDWEGLRAAQK